MASYTNTCDVASSELLTQEYWQLASEQLTHGYVMASFMLLFECIGLPWNCLVIITVFKEKLYSQPTIILLLNLTLADFFLLIVPMPLMMTTAFSGEFMLGSSDRVRCLTCQMVIIVIIPILVSLFTVALMSLDRFIYIYSPFKYERLSTKKYLIIVALVVMILVCIGMGLVVTLVPGKTYFFAPFFLCFRIYSKPYMLVPIIIGIIVILTLIFMTVINCCFAYIVTKNIKAVYSHNGLDGESQHLSRLDKIKKRIKSTRSKKQRRLCVMVSALVLSSLLTILPSLVLVLYVASSSSSSSSSPDSVSVLATIFLIIEYSQVIVHPVLHTCLVPDMYKPMKKLITCGYFNRKKQNEFSGRKEKSKFTNCLNSGGEKTSLLIMAIKAALTPQGVESITDEAAETNVTEL